MTQRTLNYLYYGFLAVVILAGLTKIVFGQPITTIASGTITLGGTFQLVFSGNCAPGSSDAGCLAQPNVRNGCTIVNNSAHNMFVWPNPKASATDNKAAQVPPGGSFNCQLFNGKVIQDPIYIDGTTADAFFAGQQ